MESWSICSLIKLSDHTDAVLSVVFSVNREYLASGSSDYTIGVWRVSSGKRIKTLYGHFGSIQNVVFSPNGETILLECGVYQAENESKPSMATLIESLV